MPKISLFVVRLLLPGSNVLAHTVINNLGGASACPGGNTLTLFVGNEQIAVNPGQSTQVNGNFESMPGLGIQINNWYWSSQELPVQRGNSQNPDNSGGQFTIDGTCKLGYGAAWYGEGIQTWKVAYVTAEKSGDGCKIVVSSNDYTQAVTPDCCAPPGTAGSTCQGPYGETNNGMSWPPN